MAHMTGKKSSKKDTATIDTTRNHKWNELVLFWGCRGGISSLLSLYRGKAVRRGKFGSPCKKHKPATPPPGNIPGGKVAGQYSCHLPLPPPRPLAAKRYQSQVDWRPLQFDKHQRRSINEAQRKSETITKQEWNSVAPIIPHNLGRNIALSLHRSSWPARN